MAGEEDADQPKHLPEEQRHYQPGAEGAPSPDEILAIPLHEFFETFGSLDQVFHVDQEALEGEAVGEQVGLQAGAGAGPEPDATV